MHLAIYYLDYDRKVKVGQISSPNEKDLIVQYNNIVCFNGKQYRIVQATYDYEVHQSVNVFEYDVIVKEVVSVLNVCPKRKQMNVDNSVTHYSKNIQNVIQKELFKATQSIRIAVAWFTNNLLFQPLLMKLALGVKVEIIINMDDINYSQDNELDFDDFVNKGGVLRWNDSKKLLHDKFCVIDDNVVISGSYNWTNKAEYNNEVVCVYMGDARTTSFYNGLFRELASNLQIVKRKQQTSTVKRTENVIRNENRQDGPITIKPRKVEYGFMKGEFEECIKKGLGLPDSNGIINIDFTYCSPLYFKECPELRFYNRIDILFEEDQFFIARDLMDLQYILLNSEFLPISNAEFDDYYHDRDKHLWLKITTNKWLFVDLSSPYGFSPVFHINQPKPNTRFLVIEYNSKYGLIDNGGMMYLDYEYDHIQIIRQSEWIYTAAVVNKAGRYGLLLLENNVFYRCMYTHEQITSMLNQVLSKQR